MGNQPSIPTCSDCHRSLKLHQFAVVALTWDKDSCTWRYAPEDVISVPIQLGKNTALARHKMEFELLRDGSNAQMLETLATVLGCPDGAVWCLEGRMNVNQKHGDIQMPCKDGSLKDSALVLFSQQSLCTCNAAAQGGKRLKAGGLSKSQTLRSPLDAPPEYASR